MSKGFDFKEKRGHREKVIDNWREELDCRCVQFKVNVGHPLSDRQWERRSAPRPHVRASKKERTEQESGK